MKKIKPTQSQQDRLERMLSILLNSTRTTPKARAENLITIAHTIRALQVLLGDIEIVAKRVGVSSQMLRDFMSVENLCPQIKNMVENRVIDSVDIASRLSRVSPQIQINIAKGLLEKKLTSQEIRDIISLHRKTPNISIENIIKRVEGVRKIKRYIIRFIPPNNTPKIPVLQNVFNEILGKENIYSISAKKTVITLVINEEGREKFQEKAKKLRLTNRGLIEYIIKRSY